MSNLKYRLVGAAFIALSFFALAKAEAVKPGSGGTGGGSTDPNCPMGSTYGEICMDIFVWAKNPETGYCCYYPSPCHVPDGWEWSDYFGFCYY